MKYVLKALNKELKDLEIRADEWYDRYQKLYEEYHDLQEENQMLRKDLQELSKEHLKKNNLWQEQEKKQ